MNFANYAAVAAALAIMPAAGNAQDAAPAPEAAPAQEAAPAAARAPAASVELTQGQTVMGNDGMPIGTVMQVTPDAVVVDTGTNQIPLPSNAFAAGESGPTLNITKAELDASYNEQMAAAMAQLDQKLVAGTPVMTADSQPLGTVDSVNGQDVVLAMEGGEQLTLGKSVFALDQSGGVVVRATMSQIQQAMNGAAPASAAGDASATPEAATPAAPEAN